jgi:hypothetical protein
MDLWIGYKKRLNYYKNHIFRMCMALSHVSNMFFRAQNIEQLSVFNVIVRGIVQQKRTNNQNVLFLIKSRKYGCTRYDKKTKISRT